MWGWGIGIAAVWFALTLALSLRAFRRRTHMSAIPTSKVRGVAMGEVEVSGVAEGPAPVTSYLAEERCLWYRWECNEHWTRTKTETYTDSKGKTQTRTVRYSGTDTVASGGDLAELYLRDDTGAVRVRWEGADVEPASMFSETVHMGEALYYGKGPSGAVSGSDGVRTFTERGIRLGAALFVAGYAREREDRVEPEIAAGEREKGGGRARHFLVTTRSEAQVLSSHSWKGWGWALVGALPAVALLVVGIMQWTGHDDIGLASDVEKRRMYQGLTLIGGGGLVAFVGAYLLAWMIMVFNDLIELRNRVKKRLANIDVQLKRRGDLVLSLVACVEGLRRHESELQTAIAQLRAQAALRDHSDPAIQSLQRMDRAMRILVERYPALVSADAFLRLQKELSDTEERIALARDDANGITAGFNARIGTFPASLIASGMGFRAMPFFSADGFERAVPRVSGLGG
jgi:hypothetical protein